MISRNLKNVLVVSVGFLFLFTAYGALQNLQVSKMPVFCFTSRYILLTLRKKKQKTQWCLNIKTTYKHGRILMMNFTVEFLLLNVAGKALQAQIHQIYKRLIIIIMIIIINYYY